MWHRLTLTLEEVAEGEERRILDIVSRAVLENNLGLNARITEMRQAGHFGDIPLHETPVEMYSIQDVDRIVLHLNDAALRLYQDHGGGRQGESAIADLPHDRAVLLIRNTLLTGA